MRKSLVVTVFLLSLCGVRAETSLPAAASPTKVVTDLYNAHRGKTDPLQYPASKKLLGAYFDKGLLSLFLKDQVESHGEVGKLDFDPLYAAQDFEIKDFSVALVAQQKESAEVAASFKNIGTQEKIVFFLSKTGQGWRITDIKYSGGRTLKRILKRGPLPRANSLLSGRQKPCNLINFALQISHSRLSWPTICEA